MTKGPPSPRVRGEGRDEGAFRPGSESRRRPLTRRASRGDLSPRGERSKWGAPKSAAGLVTVALATTLLNPRDLLHYRARRESPPNKEKRHAPLLCAARARTCRCGRCRQRGGGGRALSDP